MRLLTRSISILLSITLFVSNSVLAHATEANFWKQRHDDIKTELASLPAPAGALPSSLGENETFKLPSTLGYQKIQGHLKTECPRVASRISAIFNSLPPAWGTLRVAGLPSSSSHGPVILHIQDIHLNTEAQTHISSAIQSLIEKQTPEFVAIEGAFAPVSLYGLRHPDYRKQVTEVADELLSEDLIAGPFHAALVSRTNPTPFVGVDDRAAYDANVRAYRESRPILAQTEKSLANSGSALEAQKQKYFSPELKAFDRIVTDYRQEKISLYQFAERLSQNGHNHSFNFDTYLEASRLEENLDLKKVEQERREVLEILAARLSATEAEHLTQLSLAYRLNQIGHADFYRELESFCRSKGIDLSRTPAFKGYLHYVFLTNGIDMERLDQEIAELESATYGALAKTNREKEIVATSLRLNLTDRLIHFALTPREWRSYKTLASSFTPTMNLRPFENFYQMAEKRDRLMADRTWAMASKSNFGVVVTGGFHAQGLTESLIQKGATVVSFVPRLTKIEKGSESAYLSVFAQEKSPLQSYLEGEKLFLSPESGTPEQDIMVAGRAALDLKTPNSKTSIQTLRTLLPVLSWRAEASGGVITLRKSSKTVIVPRHGLLHPGDGSLTAQQIWDWISWLIRKGVAVGIFTIIVAGASHPSNAGAFGVFDLLFPAPRTENFLSQILMLGAVALLAGTLFVKRVPLLRLSPIKNSQSRFSGRSIFRVEMRQGATESATMAKKPSYRLIDVREKFETGDDPSKRKTTINGWFEIIKEKLKEQHRPALVNQAQIFGSTLQTDFPIAIVEMGIESIGVIADIDKDRNSLVIKIRIGPKEKIADDKLEAIRTKIKEDGGDLITISASESGSNESDNESEIQFLLPFERLVERPALPQLMSNLRLRKENKFLFDSSALELERLAREPDFESNFPRREAIQVFEDNTGAVPVKIKRWILWQLVRFPASSDDPERLKSLRESLIPFEKLDGITIQNETGVGHEIRTEIDPSGGWVLNFFYENGVGKKTSRWRKMGAWFTRKKLNQIPNGSIRFMLEDLDKLNEIKPEDGSEEDLRQWLRTIKINFDGLPKAAQDSTLINNLFLQMIEDGFQILPMFTTFSYSFSRENNFLESVTGKLSQLSGFQCTKVPTDVPGQKSVNLVKTEESSGSAGGAVTTHAARLISEKKNPLVSLLGILLAPHGAEEDYAETFWLRINKVRTNTKVSRLLHVKPQTRGMAVDENGDPIPMGVSLGQSMVGPFYILRELGLATTLLLAHFSMPATALLCAPIIFVFTTGLTYRTLMKKYPNKPIVKKWISRTSKISLTIYTIAMLATLFGDITYGYSHLVGYLLQIIFWYRVVGVGISGFSHGFMWMIESQKPIAERRNDIALARYGWKNFRLPQKVITTRSPISDTIQILFENPREFLRTVWKFFVSLFVRPSNTEIICAQILGEETVDLDLLRQEWNFLFENYQELVSDKTFIELNQYLQPDRSLDENRQHELIELITLTDFLDQSALDSRAAQAVVVEFLQTQSSFIPSLADRTPDDILLDVHLTQAFLGVKTTHSPISDTLDIISGWLGSLFSHAGESGSRTPQTDELDSAPTTSNLSKGTSIVIASPGGAAGGKAALLALVQPLKNLSDWMNNLLLDMAGTAGRQPAIASGASSNGQTIPPGSSDFSNSKTSLQAGSPFGQEAVPSSAYYNSRVASTMFPGFYSPTNSESVRSFAILSLISFMAAAIIFRMSFPNLNSPTLFVFASQALHTSALGLTWALTIVLTYVFLKGVSTTYVAPQILKAKEFLARFLGQLGYIDRPEQNPTALHEQSTPSLSQKTSSPNSTTSPMISETDLKSVMARFTESLSRRSDGTQISLDRRTALLFAHAAGYRPEEAATVLNVAVKAVNRIAEGVRANSTIDHLSEIVHYRRGVPLSYGAADIFNRIHQLLAQTSGNNGNNGASQNQPFEFFKYSDSAILKIREVAMGLLDKTSKELGGKAAARFRAEKAQEIVEKILANPQQFKKFETEWQKEIVARMALEAKQHKTYELNGLIPNDLRAKKIQATLELFMRDFAEEKLRSTSPSEINPQSDQNHGDLAPNRSRTAIDQLPLKLRASADSLLSVLKIEAGLDISINELMEIADRSLEISRSASSSFVESIPSHLDSGAAILTDLLGRVSSQLPYLPTVGLLLTAGVLEIFGFSATARVSLIVGFAASVASHVVGMATHGEEKDALPATDAAVSTAKPASAMTPEGDTEAQDNVAELIVRRAEEVVKDKRSQKIGANFLLPPISFGVRKLAVKIRDQGIIHVTNINMGRLPTVLKDVMRGRIAKGDLSLEKSRMTLQNLIRRLMAAKDLKKTIGEKDLVIPLSTKQPQVYLPEMLPAMLSSVPLSSKLYLIVNESAYHATWDVVKHLKLTGRVEVYSAGIHPVVRTKQDIDWLDMEAINSTLGYMQFHGKNLSNLIIALPDTMNIDTANISKLSYLTQVKFVLLSQWEAGELLEPYDLESLEHLAKILALEDEGA